LEAPDSEDEAIRDCEQPVDVVISEESESGRKSQTIVEDVIIQVKSKESLAKKTAVGSERVEEVEFLHDTVADMFEAAKTARMQR
jgi:hypothetical protein